MALSESGVGKIRNFQPISRRISEKRCKIGLKLLLISNRKSHTPFRLVPKSSTLDDLERPICILSQKACFFFQFYKRTFGRLRPLARPVPPILIQIYPRLSGPGEQSGSVVICGISSQHDRILACTVAGSEACLFASTTATIWLHVIRLLRTLLSPAAAASLRCN